MKREIKYWRIPAVRSVCAGWSVCGGKQETWERRREVGGRPASAAWLVKPLIWPDRRTKGNGRRWVNNDWGEWLMMMSWSYVNLYMATLSLSLSPKKIAFTFPTNNWTSGWRKQNQQSRTSLFFVTRNIVWCARRFTKFQSNWTERDPRSIGNLAQFMFNTFSNL